LRQLKIVTVISSGASTNDKTTAAALIPFINRLSLLRCLGRCLQLVHVFLQFCSQLTGTSHSALLHF